MSRKKYFFDGKRKQHGTPYRFYKYVEEGAWKKSRNG